MVCEDGNMGEDSDAGIYQKRLSLEKRAFPKGLFSIPAPVLWGLDAEKQDLSAQVADRSRDHQSVPDNSCHTTSDQHCLPDWGEGNFMGDERRSSRRSMRSTAYQIA